LLGCARGMVVGVFLRRARAGVQMNATSVVVVRQGKMGVGRSGEA
jgi:hypothetical protein